MSDIQRKLTISLVIGLAAAAIEMVPVLPIQILLGNTVEREFQSIAAGWVGLQAAFAGGAPMAWLGVATHTLVAVVAAGLYVFASERLPVLIRRPWLMGTLYGVACYVVMIFGVIPVLSKIPFGLPKSPFIFSLSFGIHLFFFGLPIGLMARWLLSGRPASAPAASAAH